MFWVISVYFNIRNTLPRFCPFLLGHPVYIFTFTVHKHPRPRRGFKPTIPASQQPHTYALDCAANGTGGNKYVRKYKYINIFGFNGEGREPRNRVQSRYLIATHHKNTSKDTNFNPNNLKQHGRKSGISCPRHYGD